jgi:hypothetical protein
MLLYPIGKQFTEYTVHCSLHMYACQLPQIQYSEFGLFKKGTILIFVVFVLCLATGHQKKEKELNYLITFFKGPRPFK